MTTPSAGAASRRTTVVAAAAAAVAALVVCACCVLRSFTPGSLEIRVVDGDAPVAGASVVLRGTIAIVGETYPVPPSRGDGHADTQGVVAFENVSSGAYRLTVGHEDFVTHREDALHVPGGEHLIHVVPLRRGVRVKGRVLDAKGVPMAGVDVQVLASRGAAGGGTSYEDLHATATTGEDGAFLTRAVEPGSPLVLRVHEFRDDRAFVAQGLLSAPRIGVNEGGVIRIRDTVTVLRLEGEAPRGELRMHGEVVVPGPNGEPWPVEFHNFYFAPDGTARVLGLPDGELRWRLVEVRLGPAPNETTLGEGRAGLAGPLRETTIRRTAAK